ncbi:MAG TPA: APC family permease [Actinomycetota bacterium]|nr:APC family permease [Actinomycetota bacterium]
MVSEEIAPVLLTRTLTSFDMVVIFIGIVLFIVNSAGFQFAGPAAFIYLLIAYLTFLIPGCFITAQLGRMFPEEGSIYVWTQKALGRFWGFFAGFVAWWPGLAAIVFAPILVVALLQTVFTGALSETWQQGVVILAVLWFSCIMSIIKQRVSQNYVNFQFFFYAAALFVMSIAGVIWLFRGNPTANDLSTGWNPFKSANVTVFAFAFLALLGIEVPLNMGAEVKNEKSIRQYLFWGGLIVMVAYLATTWSTMVVVPLDQVNGTTDAIQTVKTGFGANWLGDIVGLILVWFFVSNTAIYNYTFARLLFVSGLEKRLPASIGKVNKNKVPQNAVLLQTILASIPVIFIWFIFGSGKDFDVNVPYFAMLASANVIWAISMVVLFSDIFFVKRWFPDKFEEARRVPEGGLKLAGVLGIAASVAAVILTFWSPWYPPGFTTAQWQFWLAVITVIALVFMLVIYFVSERRAHRGGAPATVTADTPPVVAGGAE